MFTIKKENRFNAVIPDNSTTGLVDVITILRPGTIQNIKVYVNIAHGYIGDLEVKLITPGGEEFTLHNRSKGNDKNLKRTFGNDILESLQGTPCHGDWQLQVKDFAPRDEGILKSWSIQMRCAEEKNKTEIFLPAKAKARLASTQDCQTSGRVTALNLDVDFSHPAVGDLQVALCAPSGKEVVVHDRMSKGDNIKSTYGMEVLGAMVGENTAGAWTLKFKDASGQKRGTLNNWKLGIKFQDGDDLKKVEGIGPKIEGLLNGAGIFSFSSLSVTAPGIIRTILEGGGDRYKMHDPTTWPAQAALAAKGDWDELKAWQDELQGGK